MLQPVRNARRQRVASTGHFPAPVKGWDATTNIAEMPQDHAVILENFFPDYRTIRLRRGHSEHASGMGSATTVDTLMTWSGSSEKMFAAAGTAIYEVTSSGTATSVVSSLSTDRFQWANFGNAGGSYLIAVNGSDTPRYYDGSSWSALSITGSATPGNFIDVVVYKSRLYFVEDGDLAFKYLNTLAIQGTASSFNIGGICRLGGTIQKMVTVSVDGGEGPEDYLAFITSEGEVVAYNGSDPSDANDWALIGVYRIGPPIGRRCAMKFGGDAIIITQDGFVSLVSQITTDRAAAERTAITTRINPYVNDLARDHAAKFGWECISYPKGRYLLFNVPTVSGSTAEQLVMNANTGAWCRFTGMNAQSWTVFGDNLYFGGTDGKVYKADDGTDDDGSDIVGDVQTAFSPLSSRGTNKRANMIRPLLQTDGDLSPAVEVIPDYDNRLPQAQPTEVEIEGAEWDVAEWDVAEWAAGLRATYAWIGASAVGFVFSVRTRVSSSAAACEIAGWDVLFEGGDPL